MTIGPFLHEQLPARVVFGVGMLDRLPEELDRLEATRALVISNASAAEVAGQAARGLGPRLVEQISKVTPHVPREEAERAVRIAVDSGVDVLIPVGGGSAIGLAKAVALATETSIVAVPTTYAGSEMTPIYGITSAGHKRTGRDPKVLPRVVIYDPALTTGLPPEVTATTGLNGMAHAVEALYGRQTGPVVEVLASEAIGALARGLPRSVRDGNDMEARGAALYGAFLAGYVLATAGMALHHTIAHVLGGTYGLPHGPVNAALLPHVVSYNQAAAPDAVRRVGESLGSNDVPGALFDLVSSMKAPTSLRELGFSERDLKEAAHLASKSVKWNPREVTQEAVLGILEAAYEGIRPRSREER
jgi:maleylacetate reductase